MQRTIFHVDLDAFFVAVERTLDPTLVGRPVIVGGSVGSRGVVACASYEARQFGVHSAMPIATARRLCPDAVYISSHHGRYGEVSKQFVAILREHSPVVQPVSVDEAYVDMTGTEGLFGPPVAAAIEMRRRISDELSVTASIGIGASKLIAKVASGDCKPDGLLEVQASAAAAFLAPMPIRKLPGIGPKAEAALAALGITTLGALAAHPPGPLRRALGQHAALELQRRAAGIDDSELATQSEAKSISAETTFGQDVDDEAVLRARLLELSERVGRRLRRSGRYARTVTLKLRYHDFETISRQAALVRPGAGDEAIYRVARSLLERAFGHRRARVRLLGVGVGNLAEPVTQLSMLDEDERGDSQLSGAVDSIRDRFGDASIRRGGASRG